MPYCIHVRWESKTRRKQMWTVGIRGQFGEKDVTRGGEQSRWRRGNRLIIEAELCQSRQLHRTPWMDKHCVFVWECVCVRGIEQCSGRYIGTDKRSIQIWIDWQVCIDTRLTDGDALNLDSSFPLRVSQLNWPRNFFWLNREEPQWNSPWQISHLLLITMRGNKIEDELYRTKTFQI